eukprot:TRINITY_DN1919_c0_g1_i1.p1 TRINITY_DN1919_c0_g1~~TRINITY_DN1919_c0_g1_i1.p1  ORF type:complete len:217 (-),score=46.05 TRINITY_DN1919_c0_g1_i1:264-914(-)
MNRLYECGDVKDDASTGEKVLFHENVANPEDYFKLPQRYDKKPTSDDGNANKLLESEEKQTQGEKVFRPEIVADPGDCSKMPKRNDKKPTSDNGNARKLLESEEKQAQDIDFALSYSKLTAGAKPEDTLVRGTTTGVTSTAVEATDVDEDLKQDAEPAKKNSETSDYMDMEQPNSMQHQRADILLTDEENCNDLEKLKSIIRSWKAKNQRFKGQNV